MVSNQGCLPHCALVYSRQQFSRYLADGSCVYGCLVDASKAFDMVDHTLLLEKLLKRDLSLCVVRFLLIWYQMQRLRVSWNGVQSDAFPVSLGVRQGGPILFTLYIDDLLYELEQSGVVFFWDDQFVGALAYADNLTLSAPNPAALRRLLFICEQFGAAKKLKFNPDKTQIFT